MSKEEVQQTLDVGRGRFFALWKECREDSEAFSVSCQHTTPKRISAEREVALEGELLREKRHIEDPEPTILATSNYPSVTVS